MLKVLLADDEPASNEIIRHYIARHGLPLDVVKEVHSGDDAIEAIKAIKPDLVFLDIQMPIYNGLQVMAAIKREYRDEAAFIILTAYAHFEYAQQAIQLGARDFLLKPILYEQFADSLERVLGYRYTDNPLFNALLGYIQAHYMDNLTLRKCAHDLATTPSNIARMFRQQLDTSLVPYCNAVRIKAACEILKKGGAIKEASEKAGFNNLNYFYRTFKKIMGRTPKEYLGHPAAEQTPDCEIKAD